MKDWSWIAIKERKEIGEGSGEIIRTKLKVRFVPHHRPMEEEMKEILQAMAQMNQVEVVKNTEKVEDNKEKQEDDQKTLTSEETESECSPHFLSKKQQACRKVLGDVEPNQHPKDKC